MIGKLGSKSIQDSYWGLRATAEAYSVAEQFEKAKVALERLRDLETLTGERGGPLELLAQVYRKLGDTEAERMVLAETVANSSDALPSLRRLIEAVGERWRVGFRPGVRGERDRH